MRNVENPEEFRKNVTNKIDELLKNRNFSTNLEKGIFNYALKEATNRNLIKKWDNIYFVQIYNDRLRTIYFNIKNTNPIKKLLRRFS